MIFPNTPLHNLFPLRVSPLGCRWRSAILYSALGDGLGPAHYRLITDLTLPLSFQPRRKADPERLRTG